MYAIVFFYEGLCSPNKLSLGFIESHKTSVVLITRFNIFKPNSSMSEREMRRRAHCISVCFQNHTQGKPRTIGAST